jgi:hypothetical protein
MRRFSTGEEIIVFFRRRYGDRRRVRGEGGGG